MSGSCPAVRAGPSLETLSCNAPASSSACPRFRHIVTGTFNTEYLHLLAYDTVDKELFVTRSVPAQGPHQFLAAGKTARSNAASKRPDTLYATTWAQPPSLSAWKVVGLENERAGGSKDGAAHVDLHFVNSVPITATSSYVHVQPPPFDSLTAPAYGVEPAPSRYLYSAGGPTGEVHSIDPTTGALLSKEQEFNYLRDQSAEALAKADKTRKALRYGSHNFDVASNGLAYVADLGRNAVLAYRVDAQRGAAALLSETPSPRAGDGPRHVVPDPSGALVFSVTEHTSYVDVFRVADPDAARLEHVQSLDLLPAGAERHDYRGDTVRLSPDGRAVLASTRGKTKATRGIVRAWQLSGSTSGKPVRDEPLCTFVTPTSGGKANAIEFAMRYDQAGSSAASTPPAAPGSVDLAVLTDDEQGWMWILEWDGQDIREVAKTKLPGKGKNDAGEDADEGASHAVWLS